MWTNQCVCKKCIWTSKEDSKFLNKPDYVKQKGAKDKKSKDSNQKRPKVAKKGSDTVGANTDGVVGNGQYYLGEQIVPTFEEAIVGKDDHKGLVRMYAFNQTWTVESKSC